MDLFPWTFAPRAYPPAIFRSRTKQAASTGNQYRTTLARHFPEPALVMLCFLWAIWLYDGYLGPPGEAPLDTQNFAFQSIDRQLRLSDSFEARPAPLRWFAAARHHDLALERAVLQLDEVAIAGRMDDEGATVRAVLLATNGETELSRRFLPPLPSLEVRLLDATLDERQPTDADLVELGRLLQTDDARWWHLALARNHSAHPALPAGIERQEKRSEELAKLALIGRGAAWLLVLIGAFAVPRGLRMLGRGFTRKSTGYPSRWPLNLALGVFLVCELAGIGISGVYGFGSAAFPNAPAGLFLVFDVAARMLPALLACAFLFHRGRHAWRCFGGGVPIPWRALLGVFTLMFIGQEVLHQVLAPWIPVDPTGGIDSRDAGWTGLSALLVSACIVAPFSEELLYRGILFQGLSNRLGTLAAAALSALMFTVVHFYGLYGTISVGVLGIALALVYQATRSLKAVIVFHAIYNLTVTLPDWMVRHSQF